MKASVEHFARKMLEKNSSKRVMKNRSSKIRKKIKVDDISYIIVMQEIS